MSTSASRARRRTSRYAVSAPGSAFLPFPADRFRERLTLQPDRPPSRHRAESGRRPHESGLDQPFQCASEETPPALLWEAMTRLRQALTQRILVLDGAMGTMIQA